MDKDDRSKCKRNRMRNFKKQHYQNISHNNNKPTSSTSLPAENFVKEQKNKSRFEDVIPRETLSDEEEIDQGADFSSLQDSSTSGGSYFTFSSEKNWESSDTDTHFNTSEGNTYFTLNLKLLNAGLRTIPFYNRMNYPATDFTKKQINDLDADAQIFKDQYAESLNNNKFQIKSQKKHKKIVNIVEKKPKVLCNDNKDDELDDLLNLTNENLTNITLLDKTDSDKIILKDESENSIDKNPMEHNPTIVDDLQDWLDKVLE